MMRFEPDAPVPADAIEGQPHDADDERPARRLLAHDVDDSWLLDEPDGWRPID